MSFFDFEYQSKYETIIVVVMNVDKHVFYRDVYVFVDILKNLVIQHDDETIKNIVVACFCDFALMWYSIELLDYTRE